jgi:hypothetical protein
VRVAHTLQVTAAAAAAAASLGCSTKMYNEAVQEVEAVRVAHTLRAQRRNTTQSYSSTFGVCYKVYHGVLSQGFASCVTSCCHQNLQSTAGLFNACSAVPSGCRG